MMACERHNLRLFATVVHLFGFSLGVAHAQPAATADAGVDAVGIQFRTVQAQPAATSTTDGPKARNVILMISDGCGFNGWLAADFYEGKAGAQPYQVTRPDGTRPYVGASAHYALRMFGANGEVLDNDQWDAAVGVEPQGYNPRDRWTRLEGAFYNDFGEVSLPYTSYTDSGAAGTALLSGRKTSPGRINMNWDATETFQTIAHIAHEQGRATGSITTVPASHATPGAVWAQVPMRFMYEPIFRQMVDGRLNVIMGAGHPFYDDSGNRSEPASPREAEEDDTDSLEKHEQGEPPDQNFEYVGGRETWTSLTSDEGLNGYKFIEAREDFEAIAKAEGDLPEKLVGIFRARSATQAFRLGFPEDPSTPSGMAFNPDVPDLATMSLAALNVLNQNPRGFFLMIEGGGVDWMGHANAMPRFIEEQIDFNAAVAAVIEWVEAHSNWEETLLIITSDHETGGIWGEGTYETESGILHPNPLDAESRAAAQFVPGRDRFVEFRVVQDRGPGKIPGHQFASGEHTNELVPLWALGPGSSLFRQFERHDAFAKSLWEKPYGWSGNYVDNTDVFHVMKSVMQNDVPQIQNEN